MPVTYKPLHCFGGMVSLCVFIFILLASCSCEKSSTGPPPEAEPKAELTLELADVGLTEAWLRFGMDKVELPQAFSITRNGTVAFSDSLYSPDTLLYDSSLAFGSNYTYRAYRLVEGEKRDSSAVLPVSTMDTTSHDFSWEMVTFGNGSSSVLRDVAIINENDIWAVGEIYVQDSTGGETRYNAVHWDGQEWELRQIYVDYRGQPNLAPLHGVLVLPAGEIIISSGLPYLPEGNEWKLHHLWDLGILGPDDGSVYRIWGNALDNLYFVGLKGTIAHYNGSNWQKLESGTTLPIQDIWGATDPLTGEQMILCVASEKFQISEKKIIQIDPDDQSISLLEWPFSDRSIHSVWFRDHLRLWVCGAGIFINHHGRWDEFTEVPLFFTNRIRGNHNNDIFAVGDFGVVAHYNGATWKVYPEVNTPLYYSLTIKDDLMIAVGARSGIAYVLKMTR